MRFVVRSFRGSFEADTFEGAEKIAHDMILDIMTDGFDCQFWWVRLMDTKLRRYKLISCIHLGYWGVTRWFKYKEDLK